jgi:hypothetical protein
MIKHKNKIIALLIIVSALIAAWVFGGNYSRHSNGTDSISAAPLNPGADDPVDTESATTGSGSDTPETVDISAAADSGHSIPGGNISGTAELPDSPYGTTGSESSPGETPELSNQVETPELSDSGKTPGLPDLGGNSSPESSKTSEEAITPEPSKTPAETNSPKNPPVPGSTVSAPDTGSDTGSGKDKYNTDPVPEGKPLPVEPEDSTVGNGSFTVTLTVRCDNLLNNMNLLNPDKHELVSDNGVIFPVATVTAYEGESVFNVFQREMRRARIHMVFRSTPIYNSAYIEAINNLYEFDAGELSGWMYCVNGWYPNYGCSRYKLSPGDVIEWRYTCDLGRDPGQEWISEWQRDD